MCMTGYVLGKYHGFYAHDNKQVTRANQLIVWVLFVNIIYMILVFLGGSILFISDAIWISEFFQQLNENIGYNNPNW